MSVSELWEKYSKTKSRDIRNKIVEQYINFVSYLVARMMVQLPNGMDREDLFQYGVFGLIDAVERFEPKEGAKFETFAAIKIKGAIIDRIREYGKKGGGPSRTDIKKSKIIEKAIKKLEKEHGRNPNSNEIANELGLSLEEYNKLLGNISILTPVSLDKMVGLNDNLPAVEVIENVESVNPEDKVIKQEYYDRLAQEIEKLPPKEENIISLYYYHELTLKEIGKCMDLTEGRISQLHTQSLLRLKNKLSGGE